jgi:hypothetical protein
MELSTEAELVIYNEIHNSQGRSLSCCRPLAQRARFGRDDVAASERRSHRSDVRLGGRFRSSRPSQLATS